MSYFTDTFGMIYEGFFNKKKKEPEPTMAERIRVFNTSEFRKQMKESNGNTTGILVSVGWYDWFDLEEGEKSDKRMTDLTCELYDFAKGIKNSHLLNGTMKLWQSGLKASPESSKIVGFVNKIVIYNDIEDLTIYVNNAPKITDGKNRYVAAINRYDYKFGGNKNDVLKFINAFGVDNKTANSMHNEYYKRMGWDE